MKLETRQIGCNTNVLVRDVLRDLLGIIGSNRDAGNSHVEYLNELNESITLAVKCSQECSGHVPPEMQCKHRRSAVSAVMQSVYNKHSLSFLHPSIH